jgi:hypothetical protein
MIDRSECSADRHGGRQDYTNHGCRCPDAREAATRYRKRLAAGIQPQGYLDATWSRRQIEALIAIGWRLHEDLKPMLGRWPELRKGITPAMAADIDALYQRLKGTPGPSDLSRRRAASKRARGEGFLLPEQLDVLDEEDRNLPPDTKPDEEVVSRLMKRRKDIRARKVDRIEAARRMQAEGRTPNAIALAIGSSIATARKLLAA